MSSEKTKQWELSDASVEAGDAAYNECLMGTPPLQWDGKMYDAARREYAIAAVAADPLLRAAKDMQHALRYGEAALEAYLGISYATFSTDDGLGRTNDKHEQLACIRAALAKSRGEC